MSRSSFIRVAALGVAGLSGFLSACSARALTTPAASTAEGPSAPASATATPSAAVAPPTTSSSGTLDIVKEGTLQGTSLDSAIARARGYFTEVGVDSQLNTFNSGAEQTPLLGTGQLDVGVNSISQAFFNSIAQGVATKAVVEYSHLEAGVFSYAVLVRPDLMDTFKTIADLKNRKVAISNPPKSGGIGFATSKMLATANLTLDDVEWNSLQPSQTLAALANKGVEAAFVYEPFATLVANAGAGIKWVRLGDFYPGDVTGFLVFGDPFIKSRPDVARRWMVAHLHGMRDFAAYKASGKDEDVITPILTRATGLPAEVLPQILWPGINQNGAIDSTILLNDQQQLLDWGSIQQTLPIDQLYDPQFVDYAVQQLGKVTA